MPSHAPKTNMLGRPEDSDSFLFDSALKASILSEIPSEISKFSLKPLAAAAAARKRRPAAVTSSHRCNAAPRDAAL